MLRCSKKAVIVPWQIAPRYATGWRTAMNIDQSPQQAPTEVSELALMVRRWVKAELEYAGAVAVAALANQTADNIQMRFTAFRGQRALG
jgi:hypothetical protein